MGVSADVFFFRVGGGGWGLPSPRLLVDRQGNNNSPIRPYGGAYDTVAGGGAHEFSNRSGTASHKMLRRTAKGVGKPVLLAFKMVVFKNVCI